MAEVLLEAPSTGERSAARPVAEAVVLNAWPRNLGFATLVERGAFRLTDHQFQPKSDLARTNIVAGMEAFDYELTEQKDD